MVLVPGLHLNNLLACSCGYSPGMFLLRVCLYSEAKLKMMELFFFLNASWQHAACQAVMGRLMLVLRSVHPLESPRAFPQPAT